MRCLFSILFGAGVVLFTTGSRAKGALVHYKRNFLLLILGLIDVVVLLWDGDILVTYAVSGAILFVVRNQTSRWLLTAATVLIILMSLQYLVMGAGLSIIRDYVNSSDAQTETTAELREGIRTWNDFKRDFAPEDDAIEEELRIRRDSYASVWMKIVKKLPELYTFQLPVFMLADALAMMLIGMALYKADVLSAGRSIAFYTRIAILGFAIGLSVNLYEVIRTVVSDFDVLVAFAFMKPTYHIGRLGMAAGYLALVMLVCRKGLLSWRTNKLAAVGRMALTNYLSHSFICMLIFTGAGLALVGELDRWMLYVIVLAIWLFQLFFSDWWLTIFKFGPVEWIWRALTYGSMPEMKRS